MAVAFGLADMRSAIRQLGDEKDHLAGKTGKGKHTSVLNIESSSILAIGIGRESQLRVYDVVFYADGHVKVHVQRRRSLPVDLERGPNGENPLCEYIRMSPRSFVKRMWKPTQGSRVQGFRPQRAGSSQSRGCRTLGRSSGVHHRVRH